MLIPSSFHPSSKRKIRSCSPRCLKYTTNTSACSMDPSKDCMRASWRVSKWILSRPLWMTSLRTLTSTSSRRSTSKTSCGICVSMVSSTAPSTGKLTCRRSTYKTVFLWSSKTQCSTSVFSMTNSLSLALWTTSLSGLFTLTLSGAMRLRGKTGA